MLLSSLLKAQEYTLSGVISNHANGETLSGVHIIDSANPLTGVISNNYGFYSTTLSKGTHTLTIDYLGFKQIKTTITIKENKILNFTMKEKIENLKEVVLRESTSENKKRITSPQMSNIKLMAKSILRTPAVLGEPDVIKSLLLLPGVSSVSESSSGFNVRGGGADQNLILMDEAIIFNTSHLFGFFSVFNPDSIKDLTLYKGGIPARYGGRVSSVLDIYQKEGNSKEFAAVGAIGTVFSRIAVEAPIIKNKSSFIVAARRSYADLFLMFSNELKGIAAYFYDLNAKWNYKLNKNNTIYISGYFGRDVYSIDPLFENNYGNAFSNLRWSHLFSEKLFSNLSFIYSDYFYGINLPFLGFKWNIRTQNINFKYDFKHFLSNKIQLTYGFNNIYYRFDSGQITPTSENTNITTNKLTEKTANESGIYLGVTHNISPKINVYYGMRISSFIRFGQDFINEYKDNNPVLYDEKLKIYQQANPLKQRKSNSGEILAAFGNAEPRASLSFSINEKSSLKASYNRMTQYLQLISNTDSQTPLDIWTPSGPFIRPMLSDQYALGYFKNFRYFSLETEVYYKKLQNRIDYINGADLIANNAIERVILNGQGRAYGLEVSLKKTQGKLKGSIAYTLSKSEQRTPGRTSQEIGINNKKWYNTPWDKTHNLTITSEYILNRQWRINFNFTYQTGRPSNFPNGKYYFAGSLVPTYDDRNINRLPDYHRADISISHKAKKNAHRQFQSEWVFSIYNLYNRYNANSITFRPSEQDLNKNEAVKTTIFGIVPSILYNFSF